MTLTVYNSVDKSYYRNATDKLNNLFNDEKMEQYKELGKKRDVPALKRPMEDIEDDEDPEIALLAKLLAEKKAKRKLQDSEM